MPDTTYLLAPESLAQLSSDQAYERLPGKMPTAIPPLKVDFDGNYGGPIIQAYLYYGILPRVAQAWKEAGITGFTTAPMECRPSPEALVDKPGFEPPAYEELVLTMNDTQDVYRDTRRNYIRLSERAKDIIETFDLGWCAILSADEG